MSIRDNDALRPVYVLAIASDACQDNLQVQLLDR